MISKYRSLSYEITAEPEYKDDKFRITPELFELLQTLHIKARKGGIRIIEKLNHLIKKYPDVPQLKNFLTIAYLNSKKFEKAREVTHWIIEVHPDYLFGKLNLGFEHFVDKNFEKIPEILGPQMEIQALYPDRKCFHISEVTGFNKLAIMYFCSVGNLKEAETRYEFLTDLAPEHPDTKDVLPYLMLARIDNAKKRFEEEDKSKISVTTGTYNKAVQQETKPEFINQEINWLYEYDLSIDDEKLKIILQLPYESLVLDLTLVLKDSIFRYEYFKKLTEGNEEWQANLLSFPIHAIYLLGELKAEKSLPDVLETFRQGKEFIEFWYGDFMTGKFWEPLCYIVNTQKLDALKQFVLSPGVWAYARSEVSTCVARIAVNYPERKNEVINWFRDIFRTIAIASLDDQIIDTDFIGLAICNVIEIRDPQLLPEIKKLYDLGYVSSFICGDLEEVKQDIYEPVDYFDEKEFLNIYDRYHKIIADIEDELYDFNDFDDFDEDSNNRLEENSVNTRVEPIRSDPKIGRNDPCPCGSGKKYKKCCLISEPLV
jgi:hypothetical protein